MVIGTYNEFKVGEIVEGIYRLTQDEDIIIRCMILRPATRTEWFKYRREVGRPLKSGSDKAHYYWVSID